MSPLKKIIFYYSTKYNKKSRENTLGKIHFFRKKKKNAFCKMCVTICGRFRLNESGVAGYVNWMKAKYTANWGVQIVGMIFQTRSSASPLFSFVYNNSSNVLYTFSFFFTTKAILSFAWFNLWKIFLTYELPFFIKQAALRYPSSS